MINLKRILHPTDFSDYSADSTRYACALAKQFDAELHLLHVLEDHLSTTPVLGAGLAFPSKVQESRDKAIHHLTQVVDPESRTGLQIVHALAEGPPFLEIIHYAKTNAIGMIVMGTHGRSGLSHVLMGSVAERVVRKSPCPVLTVRPGGHEFVMP